MEEKIMSIYNCEKLEGDDPLVIWYNQVIEKTIDELTVADVARCIRQDLFVEFAYEMLIVYLLYDPYVGDAYRGELMDKAGEMDGKYIIKYKKSILEIIDKANNFIEEYEWECIEDKTEYEEAVAVLSEMVSCG